MFIRNIEGDEDRKKRWEMEEERGVHFLYLIFLQCEEECTSHMHINIMHGAYRY